MLSFSPHRCENVLTPREYWDIRTHNRRALHTIHVHAHPNYSKRPFLNLQVSLFSYSLPVREEGELELTFGAIFSISSTFL